VVGLDFATGNVRARCVTAAGRTVATASAGLPAPVRPAAGHSEQDATSWWPAACTALRRALADLPAGAPVAGLAITATSGTVVAVDCRGRPLGSALMYDDRRGTEATVRGWQADEPRWSALGLQPAVLSTVGRMAWLTRSHGRDIAALCHTTDLVGRHLCGHPVPADWSHTLKAGYDPLDGSWAGKTLAAAGVPDHLLPEVRSPLTIVGTVSAAAAEQTDLPEGCPVVLGMTDGCTAQLATGAAAPGQFVSTLGTTLVVKGVSADLLPDPTGAVYNHRHPDGYWLPGGASNTGGEALAFAEGRLAGLDRAAAAHGPSTVVSYPLRRTGERFPFVAPDAAGFTVGTPEDEVDAYRAALEGVAFCERLALEHLRGLGLRVQAPLLTAGGGNASEVWLGIRASVLGMPLQVAGDADSSFGAALLAAAATLHPSLPAATAAMVRPGREVEPDTTDSDRLEENYRRLRGALAERGWLTG
jgi:sugar (pentulose or hexulose) kinase